MTEKCARWKGSPSIIVTLVFLLILNITSARHCNHIPPTPDEVIRHVHLEDAHVVRRRSADQSLRIKLSYGKSVYELPEEKYNLIHNTILPEAVNYWQQALMVRKTENVIRLNRKCENNQVFLVKGDPHPYCKNKCEKRTMCGEVQVPEEHLHECRVCDSNGRNCQVLGHPVGKGIPDTDFVFYISARETERCLRGYTVAYAAHCQQEAALDRPIAGHANLCPGSINTKTQELETLLSTVKHEILHALGFSVSLYAFYRDQNGFPLTNRTENGKPILNEKLQARQWSDRVIKRVARPNWRVRGGTIMKEVNMIVTPRVVEEVRRHFDCPDLEGAELEDQGHEGTALTHWEKRVFENEAMTGTHTQNPVYSRITLALMEDTGWYRSNYHMAQPLKWGRNLGCVFAMKSCKEWMDEQTRKRKSIHPFCNKVKRDPLETECTEDRNSVALCNLIEHPETLPKQYQNFASIPHVELSRLSHFGGSVALADYCPYIQEFTWKSYNVVVRGSQCQYPENNPDEDRNFALEKYSKHSKCFDHHSEWKERTCRQIRQWQHWGSGCYQYLCANGRLHIIVANHTYTCYHTNQVIKIEILHMDWLHEGAIICPPCYETCKEHGMQCKPGTEPPKSVEYYRDEPQCGASALSASVAALLLIVLVSLHDRIPIVL